MPYSKEKRNELPQNVQAMPTSEQDRWIAIYNATFATCEKRNGKDCEALAFQYANGVAKRSPMKAAELITPNPESEHQSIMIAWWPEPELANELAKFGDVPAEELHLTIAYLGKAETITDESLAKLILMLGEKMQEEKPLSGNVNGAGVFNPSESSDNKKVLFAIADVVGLDNLRHEVMECVKECGIEVESEHGYSPHITLSYGDNPTIPNIPTMPLSITAVTLSVGDKKLTLPLLGIEETDNQADYAMSDNGLFLTDGGGHYRLFNDLPNITGTGEEWINYLPAPGVWKHPQYGTVKLTQERNSRFVNQFNQGVYQKSLPVDAEHQTKLSGALGHIKAMRLTASGAVQALVEWVKRGTDLIKGGGYRFFSPEFYDTWTDPATGQIYRDIAIGGALTTRPFFKEGSLPPVIASENGLSAFSQDNKQENFSKETERMSDDNAIKLTEIEAKLAQAEQARQLSEQKATQLAEQAQAMSEKIAKMEGEAQQRRFAETIQGGGNAPKWFGETAVHLEIMQTLGEGTPAFDAYCKQQRALAEQMKTSKIFAEVGTSAGGIITAEAKLKIEAERIAKEKGVNYAQAYSEALNQNPALYDEYEKEKGGN